MVAIGKYGLQIHAHIEDLNGAIICPECDLEMAAAHDCHIFYCGSGQFGDGHWLDARETWLEDRR